MEDQKMSGENVRNIIRNYIIPSSELSTLLEARKIYTELLFSTDFGIVIKDNDKDLIQKNIESLANAYITYSSTLNDRDQMISYIDAAITLNPNCSVPGRFMCEIKDVGIMERGLLINSVRIKYVIDDTKKEKLLVMLKTRKSRFENKC